MNTKQSKLLWCDLEMTGLEPNKSRIVEVAFIVTDMDYNQLDQIHFLIKQSPKVMENMSEWCKETFAKNGLIQKINELGKKESDVVAELSQFIKKNFDEPAVLAGNSIHQDRLFIRKWWPQIDALLHYRMLDVSSFKIIMQNKYQLYYQKKEAHEALSDIKESIGELKYYLKDFKRRGRR